MTKRSEPNYVFHKPQKAEKKLKSNPTSPVKTIDGKKKMINNIQMAPKLDRLEEKLEVESGSNIMMKNIIWLVLSLVVIYWVMLPSRKVPYKKGKSRFM